MRIEIEGTRDEIAKIITELGLEEMLQESTCRDAEDEQQKAKRDCYKCRERKVGCHSTCESYIEWRTKIDAQNEAIRKKRIVEQDAFETAQARYDKLRKG